MTRNRQVPEYEATSTSMLAGLRARDDAAWQRMVDLYGPLVYSWCRRSGISDEDAKDAVQQVFTRVLTGINTFRKDRPADTFRGWLRVITRNVLVDFARLRQHGAVAAGGTAAWERLESLSAPTDDDSGTEIDGASGDLMARALRVIKSEFPPNAFQAFQLTVLQGLNATEAARRLQSTPAAVRKAKSRILHRLRQELGDLE